MRARARRAGRPGPRPSGIVTLLTDFGLDDPYVGAVKGVLLGINPAARLVDLTHAVPAQDILRGALALDAAYRFFPPGTVHLAVVDPGVGGARGPLAVLADGHYFVGPDNGLFGFLFERPGATAVALANPAYHRPAPSRTFHARDIFAPVAAYCSRGVPLSWLGPRVRDPVRLSWPRPRRAVGRVVGQVLLADRFGNLLTNVTPADLPGPASRCEVEVGGVRIEGLVGAYGERPRGSPGALVDSSGRIEIFVREGSARERLGIGPGAPVSFSSKSRSWPRPSRTRSSQPSRPFRRSTRSGSRWSPGSRPSSPPRPPSSGPRRDSR